MTREDLEAFWAEVLSGESARIRAVLDRLDSASRRAILEHLRRMTCEPGWTEGQQKRARAALEAASPATPGAGMESPPKEHGT
jgi:hypothetical protein